MLLPEYKCEVERVCSKKHASRPILENPWLRITGENGDRRGFLEATDSYKLVSIPVQLSDGDVEGHVPVDAIKAARKVPKWTQAKIVCLADQVQVHTGNLTTATFPRNQDAINQYPKVDHIFPDTDVEHVVTFNAAFLADLAKSMGGNIVRLSFVTDSDGKPMGLKPITVECKDGAADARGLLMPIRDDH